MTYQVEQRDGLRASSFREQTQALARKSDSLMGIRSCSYEEKTSV